MQAILTKIRDFSEHPPDLIAVIEGDRKLTYLQLNQHSDVLAARLLNSSSAINSTVAYLGSVNMQIVVALLSSQKVGKTFVYLDNELPQSAILDIIIHANIKTIITSAANHHLARQLCLDRDIQILLADDSHDQDFSNARNCALTIDDDALSHIRYTSGSSGQPKGVPLNRRHVERMLMVFDELIRPDSKHRFGLFGHFWPLVILRVLSVGATLDCFDFRRLGPIALNQWMIEHAITHMFTYPVLFRQLMNVSDECLPDLEFVHLSGEPLSRSDIESFEKRTPNHARLHNSYGSSEYPWIAGFIHHHGDAIEHDTVPLGYPVPPASVFTLNKLGQAVNNGQVGEIVVLSEFLPKAYHNNVALSNETFRTEPGLNNQHAYHTGDLGYFDSQGMLHSVGRKDQQIKIRGYNVSPVDIERTLLKHPAIEQAAVIPFPGIDQQSRLACHYMLCKDYHLTKHELSSYLSQQLPGQLVPVYFKRHEILSLTSTGKLDRRALHQSLDLRKTQHPLSTGNTTENLLFKLWSDLLGHTHFDQYDDLFDIGGDSLTAMALLTRIEKSFKRTLTLEQVMLDGFNISSLKSLVDGNDAATGHIKLNHFGEQPPLFITHLAGGHFIDYLPLIDTMNSIQAVTGLYPRGINPAIQADYTIEAMAEYCIQELEKIIDPADATIAGYSYGALIAFAIIIVLSQTSRSLPRLILIDPPVQFCDSAKLLKEIGLPLRAGEWRTAFRRLIQLGPFASGFGRPPTNIDIAHRAASLGYHPGVVTGKLDATLILAEKNPRHSLIESQWSRLLDHQATIVKINATHQSLMQQPHVQDVSDQILNRLKPGYTD